MTYHEIKKLCDLEPDADWPKKLYVRINAWEELQYTLRDLEAAEIYLQRIGYIITSRVDAMDGSRRLVMVRSGDHFVDPADLLRQTIKVMDELVADSKSPKGTLVSSAWKLRDKIEIWLAHSK